MKRILIINGGSVLTHRHPQCPCFEAGSLREVALLTWKEEKSSQTLSIPIKLAQEVERDGSGKGSFCGAL